MQKFHDEAMESAESAKESARTAGIDAETAKESAESASKDAESAMESRNLSESYAVGTKNEVRDGDETDNSKYYSEQSQNSASMSKEYLEKVIQAGQDAVDLINTAADIATPDFFMDISTGHLMYSGGKFDFMVDENGHLMWGLAI